MFYSAKRCEEPGNRGRAFVIREDASQRIYGTDGAGTWTTLQVGDRNVLTEQRDAAGAPHRFPVPALGRRQRRALRPRRPPAAQRLDQYARLHDASTPATIAPRPGLLISVRDHFGRELRFTYDAVGRLA